MSTVATKKILVSMPQNLVKSIDNLVGPKKRSHFLREVVSKELKKLRLEKALEQTAGILKDNDYPQFATSKKTEKWIRNMRKASSRRIKGIVGDE